MSSPRRNSAGAGPVGRLVDKLKRTVTNDQVSSIQKSTEEIFG